MDWATIFAAIHLWAEAETGITFSWVDQKAPRPAYPYGSLEIGPVSGQGVDEVILSFNEGNDNYDTEVVGPRLFTLSIEAFSQDVSPAGSARQYVEALRDSLRKPSNVAAFDTVNIGVVRPGASQNIGRIISGESESRWGLDVQFTGASSIVDTPTDRIETIGVTGDVDGRAVGPLTI